MEPQTLAPPHDIQGLSPYVTPWQYWVILGSGILLAILFGLWLYRFLRTKKAPVEGPVVPMKKADPFDTFLKDLYDLKPQTPFKGQDQVDFFYGLSLILRGFLEAKTGINLTDMTYHEISKVLPSTKTALSDDEMADAMAFLAKADQIKFADLEVGIVEAERYQEKIEGWARTLHGRMTL